MLKQIAWNTFKNTGDINTFLELKKVQNLENALKVENYGNNKNERDNNCGK